MRIVLVFLLAGGLVSAVAHAQQSAIPKWCEKLPRPAYARLERVKASDDWFEVYRIRPGVFALYEPHQWQEVISYLIVGSKRALLFDTGMGIGKISTVTSKLTSLPITVLNSHTHHDHISGNSEFRDVLAMDLNFTRNNSHGKPHSEMAGEIGPESICGKLPGSFNPDSYVSRPFQITKWVKEGDVIDLGDRKLEIIAAPGHTPDSICLFDRANRLLWTGDTFYAGPIYLFAAETDFSAYARSVEMLAGLTPGLELLLPAHNEPVADPAVLRKLAAAVREVQSGKAAYTVNDGNREYSFDGFSLLMKDSSETRPAQQ